MTEDQVIDFYVLMSRWKKKHPLYDFKLATEGDTVYLTLFKLEMNGK